MGDKLWQSLEPLDRKALLAVAVRASQRLLVANYERIFRKSKIDSELSREMLRELRRAVIIDAAARKSDPNLSKLGIDVWDDFWSERGNGISDPLWRAIGRTFAIITFNAWEQRANTISVMRASGLLDVSLADVQRISDGMSPDDLLKLPLLPPSYRLDLFSEEQIRTATASPFGDRSFWLRWLNGIIQGSPLKHESVRAVALIDAASWRKGERNLSIQISMALANTVSDLFLQAEKIEFDRSLGLFVVAPDLPRRQDFFETSLSALSDALDDVVATLGNGLSQSSLEYRSLRRSIDFHHSNPQRIEMDCTNVRVAIVRKIASAELPASDAVMALQACLDDVIDGIRASNPDIAKSRTMLSEARFRSLSSQEQKNVEEALPILASISSGELREDFIEDGTSLIAVADAPRGQETVSESEGGNASTKLDAKVRLFSRAAKIFLHLKRTPEIVHIVDGSSTYKAARIVTTIAALITIAIALL